MTFLKQSPIGVFICSRESVGFCYRLEPRGWCLCGETFPFACRFAGLCRRGKLPRILFSCSPESYGCFDFQSSFYFLYRLLRTYGFFVFVFIFPQYPLDLKYFPAKFYFPAYCLNFLNFCLKHCHKTIRELLNVSLMFFIFLESPCLPQFDLNS